MRLASGHIPPACLFCPEMAFDTFPQLVLWLYAHLLGS